MIRWRRQGPVILHTWYNFRFKSIEIPLVSPGAGSEE